MTRLLFVSSTLAVGGAENHLRQLAPRLREYGFEPSVLTLRHEGRFFEELQREGIPVRCLHMRSRFDVFRLCLAATHVPTTPRIVVTQSIDAHIFGRIVVARSGAAQMTIEHGGPELERKLHHRLLYRLIAPGIDAAVAITEEQRSQLLALGFRGDRIRVIPNGIPPLAAQRPRRAVRDQLGFAEQNFVAALVATLRPEKRVAAFVRAVAAAHAQESRIRGVVAGGGPDLERARSLAERTGGIVRVLGDVREIGDVIAACDVTCLTSRAEGLPLAVLEAMSLGRPVLAPAVGGLVTAIESGVTGVLVPANDDRAFVDALVTLARDEPRAKSLGQAARTRFEARYTVEKMVMAYADVLRELDRATGLW